MTARLRINRLEAERIESLRALLVLDSQPEPLFDSITRMASQVCDTPIALISLLDVERQWFKSNVGLPGLSETPRNSAFCDYAVLSDELMQVTDATLDARFASNPAVCGELGLRFYAGAPLILESGLRVGTLCVLDRRPRELDAHQQQTLRALATMVAQALAMRRDLIARAEALRSDHERALARSEAIHRSMVEDQRELVSLSTIGGELVYVNPAFAIHFGRDVEALIGSDLYAGVDGNDIDGVRGQIEAVLQSGQSQQADFRTLDSSGRARWVSWTHSLQYIDGVSMLHSVGRDVTDRRQLEQAIVDNERFVRQITDYLPAQVVYLDTEGRYLYCNLPHAHRLGVDRDSMIGRTRSELTGGVDDADVQPRVQAALAGRHQKFQLWVDDNGRRALMETQLIPDIDDAGQVRGVIATAIDVTARITSERSVRELIAIFDNTPDFVIQTDAKGSLTYMNPAARAAIKLKEDDDISHLRYSSFTVPELNPGFVGSMMAAMQADSVWVGETQLRLSDDVHIPVSHMVIGHRDGNGEFERFSAVMRDITDEVRAKHQQQRQAATLRSVTEAIPAMVGVVGADRRYRFINKALERWCGMPCDQVIGQHMKELLGRPLYEASIPFIERALLGEQVSFERGPSGRDPGKHLSISYIPLWVDGDQVDGFVVVVQDVTQQKHEEKRLKHLSQRDNLTGLLNRAGLEMFLEQTAHEPQAHGLQIGMLYIDLDRFKPVNDTHGHAVGDELLKMFGERLQKLVRPTDAVVRLGGDEFAVVLTGVRESSGIGVVAEKVIAMASQPFIIGKLVVHISASVGFAFGTDIGSGWPNLLKRADEMLYQAKRAGRGCSYGEALAA